jgi:hypothetical protein
MNTMHWKPGDLRQDSLLSKVYSYNTEHPPAFQTWVMCEFQLCLWDPHKRYYYTILKISIRSVVRCLIMRMHPLLSTHFSWRI